MTIKNFQCNMLQENCFVVSDEARHEAVVIDCGAFYDGERRAIADYLHQNSLTLRHSLCTHAHMDHIFGVDALFAEFGTAPRLHPADASLYDDVGRQTASMLGIALNRTMPPVGLPLNDGESIVFGDCRMLVLHTPGHSPGSVVFHCPEEHVLFSGDTLFRMGVGRTDLPGGSWQQLMQSLNAVVAQLPADTTVYPGHGPQTTIGDELRMNPYLNAF